MCRLLFSWEKTWPDVPDPVEEGGVGVRKSFLLLYLFRIYSAVFRDIPSESETPHGGDFESLSCELTYPLLFELQELKRAVRHNKGVCEFCACIVCVL